MKSVRTLLIGLLLFVGSACQGNYESYVIHYSTRDQHCRTDYDCGASMYCGFRERDTPPVCRPISWQHK